MTHTIIAGVMTYAEMRLFWIKVALLAIPLLVALGYYVDHTTNRRFLRFFNLDEDDTEDKTGINPNNKK